MGLGKNNVRICLDVSKPDGLRLRDEAARVHLSVAEYVRQKLGAKPPPTRKGQPKPMTFSGRFTKFNKQGRDVHD